MKKVLFIIILCTFLSITLSAQNKGFYTFDIKGKVYLKEKATEKPVVRKQILSASDIIIIKENSSAVLFREIDGVPVTLKNEGQYNYKKLMELADAAKPNVTVYFLDFCKTEIIKSHDKGINKGTGVVSRGNGALPMLMPPDSSLIIDMAVTFIWQQFGNKTDYYFLITDSLDNPLVKIKTMDTLITVYPYSCRFEEGRTYKWIVSSRINPATEDIRYTFKFSSTVQNRAFVSKLDEFKKSLKFTDEVNLLLLAKYFEENKLYREALLVYEDASKKYPSDENIKYYFDKFKNKAAL